MTNPQNPPSGPVGTSTPPPGANLANTGYAAGPEGPDGPDTLLPLITEATAGEYEILGELGRGGMAAVYLANDVALNRKVAIKTMLPELIARHSMVARFKREAQMAAGLSHPHIVQIHTVKQTPKIVYFVMKFIEGRSLDSILSEHGALDLEMTRLILQQAGSALSFAHHRGVIHRDVKPANIMIDENGWAVVTDFGIAKIDDGNNLTATGTTVGTPHYMAPEQFHNKSLTGSADQYSLGIVAYEMLSGKKPFTGTTLAEIITAHLFTEPPNIRTDRPELPDSVADALQRMLAKEPEHRFPDLDAAIVGLGAPDATKVDAARGRLMSYARSGEQRAPRLSVPLSPVPVTRPSAPTSMIANVPGARANVPRTGESLAPRTLASPTPPPATRGAIPAAEGKRPNPLLWIGAAVLLLVLPGVYFGMKLMNRAPASADKNAELRQGVQLWQQGQPAAAIVHFTAAASEMPNSALPHVYLARLARERNDQPAALSEGMTAVRLEPNNALGLREMGLILVARRNYVMARTFFIRALRVDPRDKVSMGWLACTLHNLQARPDQVTMWSTRAGPGAWTSCLR